MYVIEIDNTDQDNQTARCLNNMTYRKAYDAIMTTGLIACVTSPQRETEHGYGVEPILNDVAPFIISDTEDDIALTSIGGKRIVLHADDTLTMEELPK